MWATQRCRAAAHMPTRKWVAAVQQVSLRNRDGLRLVCCAGQVVRAGMPAVVSLAEWQHIGGDV